jgi:glycosyltransferase
MDIVNEHKDIIDYVISERDSGIYDSLNKGIKAATSDVVGFLYVWHILA